MRVIANLRIPANHRVALELAARVVAAVIAAILILGVLPAIAEAIG